MMKVLPSKRIRKEEQGISMLIALLMGLVLLTGATGLMIRQLLSRKAGAAETYQQMAETAAVSGFNRILAELNNDDGNEYKGFLYAINHHSGQDVDDLKNLAGESNNTALEQWGWNSSDKKAFPTQELCITRNPYIESAQPLDKGPDKGPQPKSIDLNLEIVNPEKDGAKEEVSQRADGKAGKIKLQYRLRGYRSPGEKGVGEGVFNVEGLVYREGDEENYLARTLLIRSLYIKSIVAGYGDWAVIGGNNLELGSTEILDDYNNYGPGKIILNVSDDAINDYKESSDCINLLPKVGASANNNNLQGRIVPISNIGTPDPSWWHLLGKKTDTLNNKIRVWSFDDDPSKPLDCQQVVCVRSESNQSSIAREDLMQPNGTIRISSEEICSGQGKDCHMYVEHINLKNNTRLLIENDNRPVVLHLDLPANAKQITNGTISGSINLKEGSELCGVDKDNNNCNKKPERLIILSESSPSVSSEPCKESAETTTNMVQFEANSLPHAVIHLLHGTVKAGSKSTKLHGLIWSNNICVNNGPFKLITSSRGSATVGSRQLVVVEELNNLWGWKENNYAGYGRMVARGVRGAGLDTFRIW